MSCGHCHSLPISGIIGFFSEQSNVTESNDFLNQHQVKVTFGWISGRICDNVTVQYSVNTNSTAGDASWYYGLYIIVVSMSTMCVFSDHGEDYIFLNVDSDQPGQPIMLSSASPNHTITINILSDGKLEIPPETISIRLLFSEQQSTKNVELDPSETVIVIYGMLQE